MIRLLAFIYLFNLSIFILAQKKTFHVTPNEEGLTIQQALDQVPKYKGDYSEIEILLEEGRYHLFKPLTVNVSKGGDDDTQITIVGEGDVILSGGREVLFDKTASKFMTSQNKVSKEVNDLYVNGVRYVMARTPNQGFFDLKGIREELLPKPKGQGFQESILHLKLDEDITRDLSRLSPEALSKVRVQFIHKWDQTIRVLSGYDPSTREFSTRPAWKMKSHNPLKEGTRYFVEGYAAAMDIPGEWHQSDGNIEMWPHDDIQDVEAIVPVHTQLLAIYGSKKEKVRKVRLENIRFQHSFDNMKEYGWNPQQAAVPLNAAIWVRYAEAIDIINCSFEHMGLYAVWFEKGVVKSSVQKSYFHDLGAGGIKIGSTKRGPEAEIDVSKYNVIENNILQTGGLSYPCAVGLWIGNSGHNRILFNDISDFRYSGISIGWKLGYGPTNSHHNEIAYNKIHHLGWSMMGDMAAIYTLGESTGTWIHHNVIHDIAGFRTGYGLYEDEGTSDILFEKNLTYRTVGASFMHHFGRNNLVRNNAFGLGYTSQLKFGRVENHLSFTISDNVIYYESNYIFNGDWKNLKTHFQGNRIFHNEVARSLDSFLPTSAMRNGNTSTVERADAATLEDFITWSKQKFANFDFEIPDWERAGVYGTLLWKQRAKLPDAVIQYFQQLHITLEGAHRNMYSDLHKIEKN